MFGLAAVAIMAMALLGAGSASATVLCKENAIPCPEAKIYKAKTNVTATVEAKTSMVFKSTGGSTLDTCSGGRIEGETENVGKKGEAVKIKLAQFSFFECTFATFVRELGPLEINYIGPETRGTFTLKKTKVTINTAFGSCVYGVGEPAIDIGTAKGTTETPATLSVLAVVSKFEGSVVCPTTVVWEASYDFTEPTPLYFKEGE
jgi:hypothetical protein